MKVGLAPNTSALTLFSGLGRTYQASTTVDDSLGIDRRCFSNLFPCPIALPARLKEVNGVKLVLHDCLLDKALASTENLFQAAKCSLEADARFYFELNGGDAARYGQGRMYLTTKQKQRLVELGVDEAEIKQSGKDKFKRTHTGFCPKRDDWDEVKPLVMLVALRIKFKEMQPFREYMDNLIKSGQDVFFVEHTRNDRQWGDGSDGSGKNMLGKLITQVFLELREGREFDLDLDYLNRPNSEFVDYN
ncbi:uncharacterized protein ACA1_066860 [Acanthamoeba castellanii str. Neff]|uniref:NADAR domain-containing protein n=1 Tax=Acanthamoeba castellanii (strain ATCC 30010 / Neff) TaxID=1257118 RepID=L8GNL5_ACACF|nr:uncharacterized protein ACA1_066860 [Acanthamoeba castellanii str. Neff]ELR14645.1 hypothetical protein ACA1_066860 [Acanthamoeba castellanii str. Neff]